MTIHPHSQQHPVHNPVFEPEPTPFSQTQTLLHHPLITNRSIEFCCSSRRKRAALQLHRLVSTRVVCLAEGGLDNANIRSAMEISFLYQIRHPPVPPVRETFLAEAKISCIRLDDERDE